MDRETIRILSELGVAALALVAVVIFAYIILNRAKSDTNTIKVFADLITGSYKTVLDDVQKHGDESTARHNEILLAFQTLTALVTKIIDNENDILREIKEVKTTGNEIMATVTPLEITLQEIRDELRQLRAEVATRTDKIETRLIQVEKKATQETPKVEPETQVQSAPTKTQAKKTPNIIPLVKPEEKTE